MLHDEHWKVLSCCLLPTQRPARDSPLITMQVCHAMAENRKALGPKSLIRQFRAAKFTRVFRTRFRETMARMHHQIDLVVPQCQVHPAPQYHLSPHMTNLRDSPWCRVFGVIKAKETQRASYIGLHELPSSWRRSRNSSGLQYQHVLWNTSQISPRLRGERLLDPTPSQ